MIVVTTPTLEGKKIVIGQGGGMLMVSASGTAVLLEE